MGESDSAVLQAFLVVLIQVLVPILMSALIGLVVQQWKLARSKMSKETLATVDQIISSMVLAAEQYDLGGVVARSGAEKKAWVLHRVSAELAKLGIKIDVWMLTDLIEAAVLTQINKMKLDADSLDMLMISPGDAVVNG